MGAIATLYTLALALLLVMAITSSASCGAQAQQLTSAGATLVVVKASLDPTGAVLGSNWTGSNYCSWKGITCDTATQRVTDLNLDSNNLTGSIPSEIGKLTSLESLALSNNELSGSIPAEIGNLTSLQELALDNNNLTGSIPPAIEKLVSLQYLLLHNNHLTGPIPSEIGALASLQDLDLDNNNLTGSIPPVIGKLALLQYLYLPANRLTGPIPSEIGNLTSLQELVLGSNQLNGSIPSEIGKMTSLRYLALDNNNLTGPIPRAIEKLASLEYLVLPGNPLLCLANQTCLAITPPPTIPATSTPTPTKGSSSPKASTSAPANTGSGTLSPSPTATANVPVAAESKSSTAVIGGAVGGGAAALALTALCVVLIWRRRKRNASDDTGIKETPVYAKDDVEGGGGAAGIPLGHPLRNPWDQDGDRSAKEHSLLPGDGATHNQAGTGPMIHASHPDGDPAVTGTPTGSRSGSKSSLGTQSVPSPQQRAAFAQTWALTTLHSATDNFSATRTIGHGGFGDVYLGLLPDGSQVAVKRVRSDSASVGEDQFRAELEAISQVRHRNLVPLLGYCIESGERLLVMEYFTLGSLYRALHNPTPGEGALSWGSRLRVALGVARGLAYLHHDITPPIIHRDVKSSNVLITTNDHAVLSDFGLARLLQDDATHISTNVAGTIGYMAPEYLLGGQATPKCDVYSFGALLLELVTGKKVVHSLPGGDKISLPRYATTRLGDGQPFTALVDPVLGDEYVGNQVQAVVNLAVRCVEERPVLRPTMEEVVLELSNAANRAATDPLKPDGVLGIMGAPGPYTIATSTPQSISGYDESTNVVPEKLTSGR